MTEFGHVIDNFYEGIQKFVGTDGISRSGMMMCELRGAMSGVL